MLISCQPGVTGDVVGGVVAVVVVVDGVVVAVVAVAAFVAAVVAVVSWLRHAMSSLLSSVYIFYCCCTVR